MTVTTNLTRSTLGALLITLLVACGASTVTPSTSAPSPGSVPPAEQPSTAAASLSIIEGWPTVAQAVERLQADGYELVNDVAATGENRWTGPNPDTAPIEILGDEDAPATFAYVGEISEAPDISAAEDVIAMLPQADRLVVVDTIIATLTDVAAGTYAPRFADLSHGEVQVSPYEDGVYYVFLVPE